MSVDLRVVCQRFVSAAWDESLDARPVASTSQRAPSRTGDGLCEWARSSAWPVAGGEGHLTVGSTKCVRGRGALWSDNELELNADDETKKAV